MMFAQDIPMPTGSLKTWLAVVSGIIAMMIVGRFVQGFRNGMGVKDAALSVWLGTNTPKQKEKNDED